MRKVVAVSAFDVGSLGVAGPWGRGVRLVVARPEVFALLAAEGIGHVAVVELKTLGPEQGAQQLERILVCGCVREDICFERAFFKSNNCVWRVPSTTYSINL